MAHECFFTIQPIAGTSGGRSGVNGVGSGGKRPFPPSPFKQRETAVLAPASAALSAVGLPPHNFV
jgi:hypothetical protein